MDHNVACGAAGQHGQESGLADTGTRKQAKALALTTGGKAVQRPDTEIDARPHPGTKRGFGSGATRRSSDRATQQGTLPIERRTERIDDAAEPGGGNVEHAVKSCQQLGFCPRAKAIQRRKGHYLCQPVAEPDHLRGDYSVIARAQVQPIADRNEMAQTVDFDQKSVKVDDGAAYVSKRYSP